MDTFEIPNSMLRREHLPPPRSAWELIEPFALTFNGYGYFGNDLWSASVAERVTKLQGAGVLELASVAELRNCLFFTQRAVSRGGYGIREDQLGVVHDVLEQLRGRIEEPLADADDDALRAGSADGPLPALWFGAMLDGIVDERSLLAPLLPRVSAEAAIVACACRGLLRVLAPDGDWSVHLEAEGRTDLLVRREGTEAKWAFEWKMLWEGGLRENIEGIQKDLRKVRGRERGCALGVAYSVHKAPAAHPRFRVDVPLAATVRQAVDVLGPPLRVSREIPVVTSDVEAHLCVMAWT